MFLFYGLNFFGGAIPCTFDRSNKKSLHRDTLTAHSDYSLSIQYPIHYILHIIHITILHSKSLKQTKISKSTYIHSRTVTHSHNSLLTIFSFFFYFYFILFFLFYFIAFE